MKYQKNKSIRTYWLLFMLLVVLSQGCSEKYIDYEVAINDVIRTKKRLSEQDFIMVIPGEGCGGCISSATSYVLLNIEKFDNSIIIFTGVLDKKLLRNQIGDDLLNKANIIVDENNRLMTQELKSPYPYFFQVMNSVLQNKTDFEELEFERIYEETF